jgi:exonuclease SbcC
VSKGRDGSTHREVVEFKVYDHAKGGAERDLWDLSGGQKIVVEEALRSAIALYVNERLATPMRTCFRDETTGSLDPESAVAYMAMLRKFYELGHFYQLIYASHSPDSAALADAQIVFTAEGEFEVRYPPFDVVTFVDDEAQVA